jgi:hypothetical protein
MNKYNTNPLTVFTIEVSKMGMGILKIEIAHRQFGLTEVGQAIHKDR